MKTTCLFMLALTFAAGHALADDKAPAPKEEPSYQDRTLSEWVHQFKTGGVVERQGAVMAYQQMGVAAVPYLTEALTDQQVVNCRIWAAWGLRKLGADAKDAVPQLEITTKDDVPYVRLEAARALWAISEDKAAVPTLIELLQYKDAADVRYYAAESLGKIGPKAKDAVPLLTKALKDSGVAEFEGPVVTEYKAVSDAAAKALKKIDPEAAKKAGIE